MTLDKTKITQAVQKAFDDIATLEVATLTDPATTPINLQTGDNNQQVFEKIRTKLSGANLVAYTKYELDGDSINFISQKDELSDLVKEHSELVKSSLETRKALFGSVYAVVKDLF